MAQLSGQWPQSRRRIIDKSTSTQTHTDEVQLEPMIADCYYNLDHVILDSLSH
tara:strand:- start:93 stop:251 length:159 start_codon:yes stop_codon:yes gene_type:complete